MSGAERPAGRDIGLTEQGAVLLLCAVVVAFSVTIVPGVRDAPGFDVLYDGWLQGSAYVVCALVAVVLAYRAPSDRVTWAVLAGALVLRAAGFVTALAWVRWQVPQPYPSVADLCWLASEVALVVVLLMRVRALLPRMSLLLTLDALAGAVLSAGLALVVLDDIVTAERAPGLTDAALFTNLAYPLGDVGLLVLAGGLLAGAGMWPRRSDLLLFLGVVGFAVLDVTYLVKLYDGTFRPGTWLQVLSLTATGLLALVALVARKDGPARPPRAPFPGIASAVTIATIGPAFFVYASFEHAPVSSTLLVAGSMLIIIGRGITTLLGDRSLAGEQLSAANEELLRFKALVETSQDFIAIAGMDGQVIYVNPAGRDMVGMSRDVDITTTTIVDFLTEEGIRASLEVEQPAVVAHGHWEGESTLRDHRGGPPIPVAISSFLMHHPRTGEPFALATVQRDITERRAAAQEVEDLARQRQLLLARLVRAQDDERAEIAADVHDDSVQALAAVDLRLGLLRRKLDAYDDTTLVGDLDKAMETVRGATARLRHLLFDLESPAQTSSLADALSAAAEFVFEETPVEWELTGEEGIDLPTAQRVTAYRIAKEAMTNVRKHARASRVEIGLARGDDGVLITIADDGVGMAGPVRHRAGHRGLASGRDRATIAGGWLRAEGGEGDGTRVFVWLPDVEPLGSADIDEDDESASP